MAHGAAQPIPDPVTAKLLVSRRELLDLTLRNPLLNYSGGRRRGIEIINEDVRQVFGWLVEDGKAMRFHPTKASPSRKDDDGQTSASNGRTSRSLTKTTKTDSIDPTMADELAHLDGDGDGEQTKGGPANTANSLATPYTREVLAQRLLATWHDAWLSIQERGCNTLFLALGMLRWRESDDAQEDRFAPLVLVPVRLDRRSARSGWSLMAGDEDPGPNISLIEKMKEFGITGPEPEDLDTAEGYAAYLDRWRAAIQDRPTWSVEGDHLGLAFFSFARFLMWRDLNPAQWPADHQPGDHPILRSLFADGFRRPAEGDSEAGLDERRPPGTAMEILDCDSSQAQAIARVASGQHLVIHGPPGTGKSQTIANLIADAVAGGKRVLFVAEKLAALDVVKRRLDQCGVGAVCLELHSDKANKRAVIEELRSTLALGRPLPAAEEALVQALPGYRSRLNEYVVATATPVAPTSLSPFAAVGQLERLRPLTADIPPLATAPFARLDADRFRALREEAETLATVVAQVGIPAHHAFAGCTVLQALPTDEQALVEAVTRAGTVHEALLQCCQILAEALGVVVPATAAEVERLIAIAATAVDASDLTGVPPIAAAWAEAMTQTALTSGVTAGRTWNDHRTRWSSMLQEAAWTTDVRSARADIAIDGVSWWRRLFSGRYRTARRLLASVSTTPAISDPQRLLAACDAILAVQGASTTVSRQTTTLAPLAGPLWQSTATAWDRLEALAAWAVRFRIAIADHPQHDHLAAWVVGGWSRETLRTARDATVEALVTWTAVWTAIGQRLGHATADAAALVREPFTQTWARAQRWQDARVDLARWSAYCRSMARVREQGLDAVVTLLHDGRIAADRLVPVLDRAWASMALERAFTDRAPLREFDAPNHAQLVERFRAADHAVFAVNRVRLAHRHWEHLPAPIGYGHVGVLRKECAKKAKHLSIRQLMLQAHAAIQAAKPVFMMSPLSVAAFLPPGLVTFDLVIFDEASQVRPVDALGAILRGRQLVVVGDEQQMPPTSFFDRLVSDGENESDDEDTVVSETADMQSVLGLCLGKGMAQTMLRWHYRSRHESLIALSNQEFYANDLVVFPSPRRGLDGEGLQISHLPNTGYERGTSRTNPKEADAVIAAVVEHLRTRPQQSLGVVAFSVAQRTALEDRLENLCRQDPAIEALMKAARPEEPLFIKNLENVQGDERDVVFISVGYGKDAAGNLTMNFGPLSQQGGERRLNVLITRARVCCRVFTNLRHEDLDLRRATGRGIQVFKQFLQFAATGQLQMSTPTGGEHESPFEAEVCSELRRRGYEVEPQVGCSGYRIDLAVIDQQARGTYLLGIECDGATYHSSRWARDRDRLREAVLRSLGWRIHRIWSTDWFRRRDDALQRLLAAIEHARTVTTPAALAATPATPGVRRAADEQANGSSRFVPYTVCRLKANIGDRHLADLDPDALGRALAKVIAAESPMHIEDLRRRVLDAIEGRAGTRRLAAIDSGIEAAQRQLLIRVDGAILWGVDDRPLRPRDRTMLPDAAREAHLVHDEEYQAAVRAVVEEAHAVASIEEAVTQVILGLGVKRNADAQERAEQAVRALMAEGVVVAGAANSLTVPRR